MARELEPGERVDAMAVPATPTEAEKPKPVDDLNGRLLAVLTTDDSPRREVADALEVDDRTIQRRVEKINAEADPPPIIVTAGTGPRPTYLRLRDDGD